MPTKPSYNDTLKYLYSLEKYGIRLGLERIKAILESLDNPQDKLNIIHVAGTNGKGSTAAVIASILLKAGYKVGLYTSPHLVRFNERIRIDGKEIPNKNIAKLVERVRDRGQGTKGTEAPFVARGQNYTFFEFTTAMAFLYFAEEKVDFAVMEAGLGGRLDATNVGRPLVSIITNIAKDHEAMLGNRIEDIAFEKGGIIKRGGILISAETKPTALNILKAECKRKRTKFYRLKRDFFIDDSNKEVRSLSPNVSIGNQKPEAGNFTFKGRRWIYDGLKTNLLGRHQYLNAACALAALEILEEKGFSISEYAVRKGLQGVFWPGRLECISKKPLIVLDCAHNPAGAAVLRDALGNRFNYKRLFLVLGIMADKDIKGILSKLAPIADMVILTRPRLERAASLDLLYKHVPACIKRGKAGRFADGVRRIEGVKDACLYAMAQATADDMICVTGSVFTAGEAKKALRQL
ncbi:MAG: folylpolyglutamate synthase/dihydrofolate synthase family protein [Deltaproteobacteria bacterium]